MQMPIFLSSSDVLYPFLKKSLFRWLSEIEIDGSPEISSAIRIAQARFLRAARLYRGIEHGELLASGISPSRMLEIESGSDLIMSFEFLQIAECLGILNDAHSFWTLLDGAANKRSAQIEFIKNCPSFGNSEFKEVREYLLPTQNEYPCEVISISRNLAD